MQDFYTKISLRQMRVSDLYANEALHVQNEKSKAAMLNRPDSYLNDAIDLRVILTETPVFSSAPWSSGTRLQHFKLSSFHIHILCWKLPFQTLPEIGKQIIIKQKNEFQRNSYSQKFCLENLKMFCWKMCFVRSFIVKSNCFIRDKASIISIQCWKYKRLLYLYSSYDFNL